MSPLPKEIVAPLLVRFSKVNMPGIPFEIKSRAFFLAEDILEAYGENLETIVAINHIEDALRHVAVAAKAKGE